MTTSLATAGLVCALAPPTWVIVATSILAPKIVESGLDTVREVWHESLDVAKAGPPPAATK